MYQKWYPWSTSRDISVAALLSESSLPVGAVRDVYAVFRTFPIRTTDGHSDLGARETTWKALTRFSSAPEQLGEFSKIDGTPRRIARLSRDLTARFIQINRPTYACLTFADYLDAHARGVTHFESLPSRVRRFVDFIEESYGLRVGLISTGPGTTDMVDRR